jgi:hypothetical protein
MQAAYGRSLKGHLPSEVQADYERRGWVTAREVDGKRIQSLTAAAHEDAQRRGYLRPSENVVEPLARQFIAHLAEKLDADGGTTVLYWACGDGGGLEVLGDFTSAQCRSLALTGPKQFGTGTRLLPAVRYFTDRFRDAPKGMYVFLADGAFSDLTDVKRFTTALARDVAAGKRGFVKCVLVGVGKDIDAGQMAELDDLDTGTDVDVWDHKIAAEMRDLADIYAELVDENQIVAPSARIYGPSGAVVRKFPSGLPAKVTFELPAGAAWFELELGGRRIRQTVQVG